MSDKLRPQNGLSGGVKAQVISEEKEESLEKATGDYLEWMISSGYAESGLKAYEKILKRFLCFVREREIAWDDIFTLATLRTFQGRKSSTEVNKVIKKFACYLLEPIAHDPHAEYKQAQASQGLKDYRLHKSLILFFLDAKSDFL